MSQPIKGTAVRLPLDLHTLISDAAVENNRSRHAEMLHRLEQSFSEPAPAGHTTVDAADLEEVFTTVFTTCFNKLEERVAALLDHPMRHIYSVSIPDDGTIGPGFDFSQSSRASSLTDNSDISTEDMARMLRETHFPGYEFPLRRGTTSPTGRLSESQLEISGLHTLSSALPKRRLHSGGYTSDAALKDGEVPAILRQGHRYVYPGDPADLASKPLPSGNASVTVINIEGNQDACPLTGQNWVITGSLATMTRDRAREISMDLGGGVAGSVDRTTDALLWAPGAGSKKTRAEELGIQRYDERQFIELIRSHGVDMPLPEENEWIENKGFRPDDLRPDQLIETRTRPLGTIARRKIGDIPSVWWASSPYQPPVISHWRHANSIRTPKAEPLPEGEWIENTGVEPEGVTNKSILDFKLSTGNPVLGHHYLQGSSKGTAIWSIEGRKPHVTHWRHSAYNRQQTFAEHVTSTAPEESEGLPNLGHCPVAPGVVVRVTLTNGKVDTDYARNFDWRREAPDLLAIATWRLAK